MENVRRSVLSSNNLPVRTHPEEVLEDVDVGRPVRRSVVRVEDGLEEVGKWLGRWFSIWLSFLLVNILPVLVQLLLGLLLQNLRINPHLLKPLAKYFEGGKLEVALRILASHNFK